MFFNLFYKNLIYPKIAYEIVYRKKLIIYINSWRHLFFHLVIIIWNEAWDPISELLHAHNITVISVIIEKHSRRSYEEINKIYIGRYTIYSCIISDETYFILIQKKERKVEDKG